MQSKVTRAILPLLGVVLVLAAGMQPAAAQQPEALTVSYENLTLARDSVRVKQGAGSVALPNDTLRYLVTFANTQGRELRNVVFTNPVPQGVVLLGGSVSASAPAKIEYSIDGGASYSVQPVVTVTENGRQVRRPATPAQYTHIRWTVTGGVAPSARVVARYDVRVGAR